MLRVQRNCVRVVFGLEVGDEFRLAHEVDHGPPDIGAEVEAEMPARTLVAPLDAVLRIEYDNTIGQGLASLTPAQQRVRETVCFPRRRPLKTVQQRERFVPG